jgi:hypothetical protein
MRVTLATVVCALFFAVTATSQEIPWREITVESKWGGLGKPQKLKLVIVSKNGAVLLGKHGVDPKLLNNLIASLTSKIQTVPTTDGLGITENCLEQNVQTPQEGAPNQQALFRQNFTDLMTVTELLPSAFELARLDDYPQITVTVVLKDGSRWICASDSYYPFMLLWKVSRIGEGKGEDTYNGDISRAIAALMPEGSLNRNRLTGGELKAWLTQAVMWRIKEPWELLDGENRAPSSFAEWHRYFEVQHARIDPYRSVDYGYAGKEKGPHEENLLATLRQPSLPSDVEEDVVLLFHDGSIEGVHELAEHIGPYVSLALSIPWLSDYRANHPELKMYIRFVHDRSFSNKAMENFTADMKLLGKDSLADEVARIQDKVALVFLDYGSDWIALPDKRMILWRHYLPASFLKWTQDDFTFKRCVEYNANNGGCVGAVVSADGVLQE